ncbi:unnamed protein product [Brachionus calyciflorus]|uniref:Uncharacterized protein n=1 Tax=Brachionus calyciflorus TaxID=104777 RepID=A0A813X2Q9_9BILA|nr:unnamed protein product [Brachionus calyciflorus]
MKSLANIVLKSNYIEDQDFKPWNKENVEYNATASRSGELAQLLGQFLVSEDRIRCECKRRDAHASMIKNKKCTSLYHLNNSVRINNSY